MEENKYYSGMSLVFIGDFNPLAFQPLWFLNKGIITQETYDSIISAKEKTLISEPICIFETDNLVFNIEQKKFTIFSKKPPFDLAVEAASKIFRELSGLSFPNFGINFTFHIGLKKDDFIKYGLKIAPRRCFKKLYEKSLDDEDNISGLTNIRHTIIRDFGNVNVLIQPSKKVKYGVYFNFNFNICNKDNKMDALDVIDYCKENFEKFECESNDAADYSLEKALKDD